MKTSLLQSLRKYRPREGNDPLENFITESFAWILGNHPKFSEFFINKLKSELRLEIEIDGKMCEWITQRNFDGYFPDMVCLSNNRAIVFENKAWSPLHNNQLSNYRKYAIEKFAQSKIVLITATKSQQSQNPDLALCWSDIVRYISEWLNVQKEPRSFIFSDFSGLLVSEGMGPPAPISHESILNYYSTIDMKKNLVDLVKRTEHKDWNVSNKEGFKPKYVAGWGRIGLNLLESWTPGIFVGILLDGKDHCTKPSDENRGPDVCIIIDFDDCLHDKYPANDHYIEFVSRLARKICTRSGGWQFYDHLNDNEPRKTNKWHPIHIRKPLLDVLSGTDSVEAQTDAYFNATSSVLKAVSDEESFWHMREVLKITSNQKLHADNRHVA